MNQMANVILCVDGTPWWFCWWGIEAHKLLIPLTGIISVLYIFYQLTKIKKNAKERGQELNDLATQTSSLIAINKNVIDQVDQLKLHTQHLEGMNDQLIQSLEIHTQMLNTSLDKAERDKLRDKIAAQPHFTEGSGGGNIGGSHIEIINIGAEAKNIVISNQRGNSLKANINVPSMLKGNDCRIPLNQEGFFLLKLTFEDVYNNKFEQLISGIDVKYKVYPIKELK